MLPIDLLSKVPWVPLQRPSPPGPTARLGRCLTWLLGLLQSKKDSGLAGRGGPRAVPVRGGWSESGPVSPSLSAPRVLACPTACRGGEGPDGQRGPTSGPIAQGRFSWDPVGVPARP